MPRNLKTSARKHAPQAARRAKQTPKPKPKRKASTPALPMQRQFAFPGEGRHHDLHAIFDKLNARYFRNALRRYTITWGRKRRQRPKAYFIFGTIQEQDRIIRIHPLLDASWVPRWFLEFVIYHEMLHSVVPDIYDRKRRRRIVHTEEFAKREQRFPHYTRAQRWEAENLARFLR
jgi:hypothetical protein